MPQLTRATVIANAARNKRGQAGFIEFSDDATAASATIRATEGKNDYPESHIKFAFDSSGGKARLELLGSKTDVDVFSHNGPLTVGSIEGKGLVDTGYRSIAVGSNDRDTEFPGLITGIASIMKVGEGELVLENANTYSGTNGAIAGTVVLHGTLLVNNPTGSGTGTGTVLVRAGTLGGTGIIAGAVTIGDGGNQHALLIPGNANNPLASLTIESNLSFGDNAILSITIDSDTNTAAAVNANGVTIDGAQFSINDDGSSTLPNGTVITPVRNTAATTTSGTFSNLPDGGTITVGANSFRANYEGGDGNDLTLTVVQ